MLMTYDQARADHEYLWGIGPGKDMTGAYVDQDDLTRLLKSPNKRTARACYCDQIAHWFAHGPDCGRDEIPWDDPKVLEIARRHDIIPDTSFQDD